MTIRYASWGIIIDDIVFPDGRTEMGVLGGGGLYTAVGIRFWNPDVGLIASVGNDFDYGLLEPYRIDTSLVKKTDLPAARAWQVFEFDGKRTQVPRIRLEEWSAQLSRRILPDNLPDSLQVVHYHSTGNRQEGEILQYLREKGMRLCGEPIIDVTTSPDEIAYLAETLCYYEIFSPGGQELSLLVKSTNTVDQVKELADYGPRIIALRQGSAGSVVYDNETGDMYQVPVAKAAIVDVTGAGNAYCGGLLAGWVEEGDLRFAAACASASASLTIEQLGPPSVTDETIAKAHARQQEVLSAITSL